MGLIKIILQWNGCKQHSVLLNYPTTCMLYATHLVSMLHPEPAWIDPSGVLKYTSSTYAIIFFCQIYETAGFNRQHIGSRGLEEYFCFLMAMSHIGLQSWRVTHLPSSRRNRKVFVIYQSSVSMHVNTFVQACIMDFTQYINSVSSCYVMFHVFLASLLFSTTF